MKKRSPNRFTSQKDVSRFFFLLQKCVIDLNIQNKLGIIIGTDVNK